MRNVLFVALLLCQPIIAWADLVEVRSGQHPGFVRLYVSASATAGVWSAIEEPGGIRLSHSSEKAQYDTSSVFARIDTQTITALDTPSPGTLAIQTSCQCRHELTMLGDGSAFLDIFDEPGSQLRPKARPGPAAAPMLPSPIASELSTPLALSSPEILSQIGELEQSLTQTVRTDSGSFPRPAAPRAPAMDMAPSSKTATPPPHGRTLCFSTELYAMLRAEPPGTENPSVQTAHTRMDGPLDDNSLVTLARSELRRGHGLEARMIARAVSTSSPESDFIANVGALIEDLPSLVPDTPHHCAPAGIIWGILAGDATDPLTNEEAHALVQKARTLPEPVANGIAARLGEFLSDSGFPTLSKSLSNQTSDIEMPSESALWEASTSELNATRPTAPTVVDSDAANHPLPVSESLAYENRDESRGDDLNTERLKALLAASDYANARTILSEHPEPLRSHYVRATLYARALATKASENEFLEGVFGLAPDDVSLRARRAVSKRLEELGFRDQALIWVGGATNAGAPEEVRPGRPAPSSTDAAPTLSVMGRARSELSSADDLRLQTLAILNH